MHTVTSSWFFFSTHMQRCTDRQTSILATVLFEDQAEDERVSSRWNCWEGKWLKLAEDRI